MKFTINTKELIATINKHKKITSIKSNFSILSNIMFDNRVGTLNIVSTCMEHTVITEHNSAILSGSIPYTVNLASIEKIVKKCKADDITFTKLDTDYFVTIDTGIAKFEIVTTSTMEFPEVYPEGEIVKQFDIEMGAKTIKEMLNYVSDDVSQYMLGGVNFNSIDGELRTEAINGRMLLATNTGVDFTGEHFIVRGDMLKVIGAVEKSKDAVFYTGNCNGKKIVIQYGSTTYITSPLDGKFPDVNMFMEGKQDNNVVMERKDLLNKLDAISPLVDPESNKVIFDVTKEAVKLEANNSDIGKGKATVDCKATNGAVFGLNYKLFTIVLNTLQGTDITMEYKTTIAPIRMTEGNKVIVIMPMKLD